MDKRFYLDTEFHEYEINGIDTIELISIGIINDDKKYYAICKDFDIDKAWENTWLRENVLNNLFETNEELTLKELKSFISEKGLTREEIKNDLLNEFIDYPYPLFYTYYGSYDWVVFCWIFGRMMDLPKNYPMYTIDLKQELDKVTDKDIREYCIKYKVLMNHLVNCDDGTFYRDITLLQEYPKKLNNHNALDDAKWNKVLHEFIIKIKSSRL